LMAATGFLTVMAVLLDLVGSHYKPCKYREKENPCGFSS